MAFEVDFLPVGESNGDAICLRYGTEPPYTIHVVDGGFVDTGPQIVDHINRFYGHLNHIDHVVLTHTDRDHAGGLKSVLEHFDVGTLWMNRPWLYAEETVHAFHGNYTVSGLEKAIRAAYDVVAELEDLAMERQIPIYEVFAGDRIGNFLVLAPTKERYLELIPEFAATPSSYAQPQKGFVAKVAEALREAEWWFETWVDEKLSERPPPTTPNNEASVVQLGFLDDSRFLLTADAGPDALIRAAQTASAMGCLEAPNCIQVPHHGSRRNVTPRVLDTWLGCRVSEGESRGYAFCSVGSKKTDYPRKRVQNAFLRRGYGVIPNHNRWINQGDGFPLRPGAVPVYPEPFVSQYKE